MQKGQVLVVAGDEPFTALLARIFRGAGYDVAVAYSAQEGVAKGRDTPPDCIVCDADLPDIEGHFVVRSLREDAGKVAVVPVVLLTNAGDLETSLRGLRVGADAYVHKPVNQMELVGQVEALVAMKNRLQERRDSVIPMSVRAPPAVRGDLEQMSLATVLMVIEMERRSGRLNVESADGTKAVFAIAEATFVVTTIDGKLFDTIQALRSTLTWPKGRFWFTPSEKPEPPNPKGSIGGIILEAMRQNDEAAT